MMTDKQTREAAAIAAALLLARLAHLRLTCNPDRPVLPFRNYLEASTARLLLVPTIEPVGSDTATIGEAVQRIGYNALVVRAIGRTAADTRFEVAMRDGEVTWSPPLRLWIGADGSVHLVPDEADASCYAVTATGLRARKSPPWTEHLYSDAGLRLGERELARVLEGR